MLNHDSPSSHSFHKMKTNQGDCSSPLQEQKREPALPGRARNVAQACGLQRPSLAAGERVPDNTLVPQNSEPCASRHCCQQVLPSLVFLSCGKNDHRLGKRRLLAGCILQGQSRWAHRQEGTSPSDHMHSLLRPQPATTSTGWHHGWPDPCQEHQPSPAPCQPCCTSCTTTGRWTAMSLGWRHGANR